MEGKIIVTVYLVPICLLSCVYVIKTCKFPSRHCPKRVVIARYRRPTIPVGKR